MLRCKFDDHGAVAAVREQDALVLASVVRDGGDAAMVSSDDRHVVSMVKAECHVAHIVKWVNKSLELAWVAVRVFFPVV